MWPIVDNMPNLSEHQRETLRKSLSGPVGILAGPPGCGKTWTAAAVVRSLVDAHGYGSVAVCAPTGKAAVRSTATMQGMGINLEATTIHRLLGVDKLGYSDGQWGFIHGPNCPLPYRFVIVDEPSMLGTSLGASLFSAFRPGTHVLLVGDPYQLPPVEHGAPLRDLIAAGIPYGELTEIWRNDGGIVRACRLLKEGRGYHPSQRIDVPAGENLKHYECRNPGQQLDVLQGLYRNVPSSVDPMWDVQVLVTVNEKSAVSRKELNRLLQELLNPDGQRVESIRFRQGDKVICTTNTMLGLIENGEEVTADSPTGEGRVKIWEFVANGEIGRVVRLHEKPRWMHVAFDCPKRVVKVDVSGGDSGVGDDFDLAYAITIHKSQGSSWPIVVTMIDDYAGAAMVACRELYYTAISRVEKLGFTIGRMGTINQHCKKVSLKGRKTFLRERLAEGEAA